MIAKIIPLRRMPSHLSVLDYLVPKEQEEQIAVGQLVTIPLHTTQQFGVVLSLQETSTLPPAQQQKIKPLTTPVQDIPLFSKRQLHVITILAKWYGVSISSMAKIMSLPLQKRKLKQIMLQPFDDASTQQVNTATTTYQLYTTPQQQYKQLTQHISQTGQTLIVVPEVSMIEPLRLCIEKEFPKKHCTLWSSALKQKEHFANWLSVRNGDADIIIGTRSAVLLPFYHLKQIIIDREEHKEHKHWDQQPRFHVKDVALLLQKIYGCGIHLQGVSPSVDVQKQFTDAALPDHLSHTPRIIDMRSQRAAKDYSPFSDALQHILAQPQGDVFLFLNRKGYATSFTCLDCGFVHTCTTCHLPLVYHQKKNILACHYCHATYPLQFTCPSCASPVVRLRGMGTELIEDEVKKMVPDTTAVIRIDGEKEPDLENTPSPRVIIGTQRAFRYMNWQQLRHVACLDLDRHLALPEYAATEDTFHFIHDIMFRLPTQAELLIQTRNPEHDFFAFLAHPKSFYDKEQQLRKQFSYPPYGYTVKYIFGHARKPYAKGQATQAYNTLHPLLTKAGKSIMIHRPMELHPGYYRGKHWYAILVTITETDWMNTLLWLNKYIPTTWKVDPRPQSLLSQ